MKNYPLLRKTLEHIEAHPEEHNQMYWGEKTACGTTLCFAGHAVLLAGAEPVWMTYGDSEAFYMNTVTMNGMDETTEFAATDLLGLTYEEGVTLFSDCTTLRDVQKVVNGWLADE